MAGLIKGRGLAAAEAALQIIFGQTKLTSSTIDLLGNAALAIFKNFEVESKRVADFKIDIHWKSRVINAPRAVQHFKDLWVKIDAFIKTKGQFLRKPFEDFVTAVNAIATTPPEPGVSKIVAGFAELQAFVFALDTLLTNLESTLKQIAEFQDLFDTILNDIETLDGVFLPQNTQRNKTTVTYFKRS